MYACPYWPLKEVLGEAVMAASHVINLSPSVPLGGKCPDEVFYNKPPRYDHLRVFGCAAYVHQTGDKLDARSKKCVFLGYPEGVKGYRLWDRSLPGFKTIVSRNVIFNESEFPCQIQSDSVPAVKSKPDDDLPVPESDFLTPLNPDDYDDFNPDIPDPVVHDTSESETEHVDDSSGQDSDSQEVFDNPLFDNVQFDDHDEGLEIGGDVLEDLQNYQLARDREAREKRPSVKLRDYELTNFACNVFEALSGSEPKSYSEAIKSKESDKWIDAMNEEMTSLYVNKTWILVPKPENASVVQCKWLFKIKKESDNLRYKTRLVAKGFTQKEGIDYTEIFAPVAKFTTVKIMLALVAQFDWEMIQMDVKIAFLHGDLDRDIYMHQPEGYVDKDKSGHVCLLKKALYGLKQSPRQWNLKFDDCMKSLGFDRSKFDHCLYFKNLKLKPVFLLLYVDDMLLIGPSMSEISIVKQNLSKSFEMKDLGNAKHILGMDIVRDRTANKLVLKQTDYVFKILAKFCMSNAKGVRVPMASHFILSKFQCPETNAEKKDMETVPYASAIGSVMYLMVSTRPDLAYSVSCLSRYMANPGRTHWKAMKWLLRYLQYSANFGLSFSKSNDVKLQGFVDSNYANDRDNRKSSTCYVFTLCGSCISWKSHLQPVVASSTMEAEYVALSDCFKEAIWLKGLLNELGYCKTVVVYSDSQSTIQLCKNPVFHDRSKHIEVKFHFIRDVIDRDVIELEKVVSHLNPADIGIKPLPAERVRSCQKLLHFDFG